MNRDPGPPSIPLPNIFARGANNAPQSHYNPALRRRELELELDAKKKEVDQFIIAKQQCVAASLFGPLASDPNVPLPQRTADNIGKTAMMAQCYDALMQAAITRVAELGSF